ncbi:hypothetical protein [Clostridium sp. SM-530-WT-3G]|uniref:hypothetical protein n=1 Tax=Clostridium sp. SM-530-WT-3G TaxID=2725303 RepID=UPI00145DC88E|nr:hypothetical protein [Clostridium sp. SM-530-WT-3G]NME83564.1 hypothetical protein [Clostridium sp. SM-530-WT-3G]
MRNNLLIPINTVEFKTNVNIKFNNILSGFDNFLNFTIDAKNIKDGEIKLITLIEKIFEENNNECYIDLYLNNLSEEDKENLLNLISDTYDNELLKEIINLKHNTPYYKLKDKSLIPLLTKLNTREIFFVTFYFVKKTITIWGNYNLNFPCFFNTKNTLEEYLNLVNTFDFNIQNINLNI